MNPLAEYPISVTKINQVLSLLISCIWGFMAYRAFEAYCTLDLWKTIAMFVTGFGGITLLVFLTCRGRPGKTKGSKEAIFVKRPFK